MRGRSEVYQEANFFLATNALTPSQKIERPAFGWSFELSKDLVRRANLDPVTDS